MKDEPAAGSSAPSPCNQVCRIDAASGRCQGCCRTLAEIAAWRDMSAPQKRALWRLLDQRRAAAAG